MARILTKLRISEVSAVDAGAGDGTKIVLMKRDDTPRSKPHVERHARRLRKFEEIFMRKELDNMETSSTTGATYNRTRRPPDADVFDGDDRVDDDNDDGDIEKQADRHASMVADLLVEAGSFPHRAAALQHLLHKPSGQALLARMHKAADQTEKESNMRTETLESILKDGGPVSVCKSIVDRGRSPCGEHELVAALSKQAGGDRAFAELHGAEESVRRACAIAKAREFSVFDIKPVVVGGVDAMNDANDADDSAVLRAHEEILRIGREKFPFLPADQQFARIFEDRNYAALAAQAHSRPQPTTIYRMPGSAAPGRGAYTKADPAPSADSAYAALMRKAEEYRTAHPDLSISQAFEAIYTDRANIDLAKRERIESAPR
jgi:hypothetical protein